MTEKSELRFVDLFCGAGGSSEGVRKAGFRCVGAADSWDLAIKVHGARFGEQVSLCRDMTQMTPQEFLEECPEASEPDLLIGGPPCQTFSLMGSRSRSKPGEGTLESDPRHTLFEPFFEFIRVLRPRYFVMENVPGIRTAVDAQRQCILSRLLDLAEKAGYQCQYRDLDASHFSVPQKRVRFFLFGSRKDQRILDLSPLEHGPTKDHPVPAGQCLETAQWFLGCSQGREYFLSPESPVWTKLDQRERHQEPKGSKCRVRILRHDQPSPTLMASYGTARDLFVRMAVPNGEEDKKEHRYRRLTLKEFASLSTFPSDFPWAGNPNQQFRLMGNAVPPNLAFHLARLIRHHCDDDVNPQFPFSFLSQAEMNSLSFSLPFTFGEYPTAQPKEKIKLDLSSTQVLRVVGQKRDTWKAKLCDSTSTVPAKSRRVQLENPIHTNSPLFLVAMDLPLACLSNQSSDLVVST